MYEGLRAVPDTVAAPTDPQPCLYAGHAEVMRASYETICHRAMAYDQLFARHHPQAQEAARDRQTVASAIVGCLTPESAHATVRVFMEGDLFSRALAGLLLVASIEGDHMSTERTVPYWQRLLADRSSFVSGTALQTAQTFVGNMAVRTDEGAGRQHLWAALRLGSTVNEPRRPLDDTI